MSKFTFDVFISYSHADAGWVKTWLLPRLEDAGLRVCIDDRDFKLGVPSLNNMADAAVLSRKTLFVMTPHWTVSEYGQFESLVTQTIDPIGRKGRLLPLMLKDCDLPARLQILTYADFRDSGNWEPELARVVKDISEAPDAAQAAGAPPGLSPNLAHPYPMQANFTGRAEEREELTAWLAADERPVCALVAMGGMGKSALAWHWLKHDVLPGAQPAAAPAVDGVMWWSFYEGESSFARFVDEALRYVGARAIDAERFPTTYDRAQELRRLLQSRRVLFILDGFERQLRAYAALDAVYRPDDAAEPSRDARSCVDPTASRLLRDIAAGATRAKVLLTTRLMPSDLEDRAGDPLAGALKRELKELPRDDAVAFMRAQGVTKGTPAEVAAACADYGYHPLSLRLLSGLIARDARTPGDIAAAPRHDVHSDLIQRQHHILEQSYNALPKRERALLSRIAAFRNPVPYDALLIFNTLGNEAKFQAALGDLQARGLLQRDIARSRYDLHPIVRHYCYDRLPGKTGVHARLRDFFAGFALPAVEDVRTIEDLAPAVELYHHSVLAGRRDEAYDLFSESLSSALYYRLGAYQTDNELLHMLFDGEEGSLPRLSDERAQAWTLNALATSYGNVGLPRDGARVQQLGNTIYERLGDKVNLAIGLINLSDNQLSLGELAAAEASLRRGIDLSREAGREDIEAVSRSRLGNVFSCCGAFDEAAEELAAALEHFEREGKIQATCFVWALRSLHALRMLNVGDALEAAIHAHGIATSRRNERDIIRAELLLGAALTVERKNLDAAALHLTEALIQCRRINMLDHEPDILLAWARWHRARGSVREGLTYAGEALAIADRCEYRLKQAEIHNLLVRLSLDTGERGAARAHGEIAKERAWCDGPPHCYKPALDEAEAMLRELGVGKEQ